MTFDRQRYAAVRLLEARGFRWDGTAWAGPAEIPSAVLPVLIAAADAMHDELTGQIEDLAGAVGGSWEAETLRHLLDLVQAYEAARPRD